jgi:hypothetical protein
MFSSLLIRLFALCGLSLAPFWAGGIATVLLGAALAAGSIKIYDAGYAAADAKCEAAALQSQLDALRADREIALKALSDAKLKLAALEQQSQDNEERTVAYVKELQTRPVPNCNLSDDDLRGMRASTHPGGARSRPAARAGVPGAGQGAPAQAR